jgi:thiopurine S-methyltransferase
MEPTYWKERWSEGRIGFHEGRPNAHLVEHASFFEGRRRVLVPLCGKTVDLAYLASRGLAVVGVELVEDAARAFFEEAGVPAHRTVDGPLARWEGAGIEIVCGDFFDVGASELGGTFDACFDRAAIVALPPDMRRRYVDHLRTLLSPGARVLLVSFEHDGPKEEPPFSVDEAEIRALHRGASIEEVGDADVTATSPAIVGRGARVVRETVWRIELSP